MLAYSIEDVFFRKIEESFVGWIHKTSQTWLYRQKYPVKVIQYFPVNSVTVALATVKLRVRSFYRHHLFHQNIAANEHTFAMYQAPHNQCSNISVELFATCVASTQIFNAFNTLVTVYLMCVAWHRLFQQSI